MLTYFILLSTALSVIVVLFHYFKYGFFKFTKFKFSICNYYLMMSGFVFSLIAYSIKINSFKTIIIFVSFAIFGVLAETFINFWWQIFFGQRLWVYSIETLYHKYTSLLNFIPWGAGGFLYVLIANRFFNIFFYPKIEIIFFLLFPILIFIQKMTFDLFKPSPHFKFHSVNIPNSLFFFAPIFALLFVATFLYGSKIMVLFFAFGIIATFIEYLFGKMCSLLISKRLWYYTYLSLDGGHFTPISIPIFAIGGFYFLILAKLLVF